jgi:hypothetical protein
MLRDVFNSREFLFLLRIKDIPQHFAFDVIFNAFSSLYSWAISSRCLLIANEDFFRIRE